MSDDIKAAVPCPGPQCGFVHNPADPHCPRCGFVRFEDSKVPDWAKANLALLKAALK